MRGRSSPTLRSPGFAYGSICKNPIRARAFEQSDVRHDFAPHLPSAKLRYHLCVILRALRVLCGFLFAVAACTQPPNASRGSHTPGQTIALLSPPRGEVRGVYTLSAQLAALSPTVSTAEANRVAACAHVTARQLTVEYSIVGPALFHNFLVNAGIRKRGLCYQWAQDLIGRLDALKLTTLELHWGVARPRTLREHNCVVVTANGQPFREGVLLDCWRHGGRLYYGKVGTDHYPWKEDRWNWRGEAKIADAR
jgi:hypothetical protein